MTIPSPVGVTDHADGSDPVLCSSGKGKAADEGGGKGAVENAATGEGTGGHVGDKFRVCQEGEYLKTGESQPTFSWCPRRVIPRA